VASSSAALDVAYGSAPDSHSIERAAEILIGEELLRDLPDLAHRFHADDRGDRRQVRRGYRFEENLRPGMNAVKRRRQRLGKEIMDAGRLRPLLQLVLLHHVEARLAFGFGTRGRSRREQRGHGRKETTAIEDHAPHCIRWTRAVC
jgi:hypothetical protein